MKIKLGIIGSIETIDKIKSVLEEFKDKIDVYIYCYHHKKETIEMLEECQRKADVILFSGQVPYSVALQDHNIKQPTVFIPRTGTSVYRAFWQMKMEGINISRVSFDTIEQHAIEEVVKELDITLDNIYVKSYPGDIDYNELTDFHYKLWQEGKINAAATCLSLTYRNLKDLGVPVFRLFPTRSLIREYINKAIYKGNVEKIKATQIAVQIVKIKNQNRSISTEYEFLKIKNKLEEGLICYAQENFGSIFPFGRDEYLIFMTRGTIDAYSTSFKLPRYIDAESAMQVELASGIGFGDSVHEAEVNARNALEYALKENKNCCYILDEKGLILGPIFEEDSNPLSYDLLVANNDVLEMAKKIQISPSYVSKIKSILLKMNKSFIEAEELANYLGISVRSARRILKQIVDAGYGSITASESRAGIGRPRQIYEINL
ncbi:MAG TPA: hypothetical protein VEF53_06680 [Patescibacteria group bacterium]|nr:hypothetical protein [Patescibacteria group bacterium]